MRQAKINFGVVQLHFHLYLLIEIFMTSNAIDNYLEHYPFQPHWESKYEDTICDIKKHVPRKYLPDDLGKVHPLHICNLHPFFNMKPQKFYKEEIFLKFLSFHLDFFEKDNATQKVFQQIDSYFTEAWFKLKKFNKRVQETNLEEKSREEKFRTFILPWYAHHLCEDIYDNLLALPMRCVEKNRDKRQGAYSNLGTNKKVTDILSNERGLEFLTCYHNALIRNAASHPSGQIIFESDGMILFQDRGKEEKFFDEEIIDLVEDMLDLCNAVAFATKVLYVKYFHLLKNSVLRAKNVKRKFKDSYLKDTVKSPFVEVEDIEKINSISNTGKQLNIEVNINPSENKLLFMEGLRCMLITYEFYPDVDSIFVGSGDQGSAFYIRARTKDIKKWKEGIIDDREFLSIITDDSLIFPGFEEGVINELKGKIKRFMLILTYKFKKEYRSRIENYERANEPVWKILNRSEKSVGNVIRFQAKVLIEKGLKKEKIKEILSNVKDRIVKDTNANYVWVFAFDREKRDRDMIALENLPYYVCQAEYYDGSNEDVGYTHSDYDEELGRIRISWNRNYFQNNQPI